jgi:hypothetical protein
MRVVDWQRANKPSGGDCGFARLRPVTGIATMATAPSAAERSFGTHHNYIERPWGPGGASPG